MSTNTHEPTRNAHDQLDNPGWHALTGALARFAEGTGKARRFRRDVAMFGAIADDSAEAWSDLATIVGPGGEVVLIRSAAIAPPQGWTEVFAGTGHQMVLQAAPTIPDAPGTRPLTDDDVEEMMALVKLTEPGPFRPRTIELGGYLGIFDDDRLMAMAGRRMAIDDHVEISAVCTHPDGRRRGYGAAITSSVARGIIADGKTPILHVSTTNQSAKSVYDNLGFVARTQMTFGMYRRAEQLPS